MANTSPLLTSGLILQGSASKSGSGKITDTDVSIFYDENGNIVFRDSFVVDYLKRDSISLKDIYTKTQGVYEKDGQLYFKDASVTRAYSLSEIVESFNSWKKNLKPGSLYWIGRNETDHKSCANLPRTSDLSDTNKLYWSVDRYLQDTTGVSPCTPLKATSFASKVKTENGDWKWHDVQGISIVVPPIEDKNKLAIIVAKLAYNQKNGSEPIVFRLYDATAKVELTRIAVSQNNGEYISYPIALQYFGNLPIAGFTEANLADKNNTSVACAVEEDCGCTTVDCVTDDPTCFTPNKNYVSKSFAANSHLIKVQFFVADYHGDHWDRYFGSDIDTLAASKSSIDVAIFDASPATKYIRQHGSLKFNKISEYNVIFDQVLTTRKYSVGLSCDKNVNVWYTDKTEQGFTIKAELPFVGNVDWTLLNINN